MKKKFKFISLSFIAGLLILSGCGQNAGEAPMNENGEETYKVGISQYVEHPSLDAATKGFKQALADEGLAVEYNEQNAQADQNNTLPIAQNFVGDQVDLIFANATPSAQGALNATMDIPIIFTSVTDPIGADLVESMEKPGTNITGTTDTHPDAIPNTVKFMDQYMDGNKIGMVYSSGEQNSIAQIDLVEKAMEGTDLEIVEAPVSTSAEVKQATESLIGQVDAFYIITDNIVVSALESVIQVAQDEDIPLFVGELDSVARGGFAAYGFSYEDIGYEAGLMAAQILKGEKTPAETPVQYPQNLKLVINKSAAREMGIDLLKEWEDIAEFVE